MGLRLAVETAFPDVSVALDADGTLLEPRIDLGARRAAALHAAVDDLLTQAAAKASQLEEIWIDVGPGSYTGLRVGIALARTLADVVGVSIRTLRSTDQLAWAARDLLPADVAELLVCLDARRGSWYGARYRYVEERLELLEAPQCLAPEALRRAAVDVGAAVHVGSRPPLDVTGVEVGIPHARALFDLAHLATEDAEPAPVYLMPPV